MNQHGRDWVVEEEAPRRITWRRVELEDEILFVLDTAPEPGERIEMAFRRKEQELIVILARLSVLDSMELHRRLTLGLSGDPVATGFVRLIAERRARLMAFLAGARRREALRLAR